jgi:hypothetical protein
MGAYTLIGQSSSSPSHRTPAKYIQMACFITYPTLHIRLFDRTSDACERCLVEEYSLNHSLCDQIQSFRFHDIDQEHLCLNIDYELTSTTRLHLAYRELSFQTIWNEHIDQTCLTFTLPDLHIDRRALHIDLYQEAKLDCALHVRLPLEPCRVCSFYVVISYLLINSFFHSSYHQILYRGRIVND